MTDTEALETLKQWTLRNHALHAAIGKLRESLSSVGLKFDVNEDRASMDPFERYERFRPSIVYRAPGYTSESGWRVRLTKSHGDWPIGDCKVNVFQPVAPTVAEAVAIAAGPVLSLFAEMEAQIEHFKRVVVVASERIAKVDA